MHPDDETVASFWRLTSSRLIAAFVRGLIAADYSARTIDASRERPSANSPPSSRPAGSTAWAMIARADIQPRPCRSRRDPALGEPHHAGPGQLTRARRPAVRPQHHRRVSSRWCGASCVSVRTTTLSKRARPRVWARPSCHGAFRRCSRPTRWVGCSMRSKGQDPLELRDRALFELIYASGLRCQEVLDLKLRDVSFDSCEIRAKGKGRKVRVVPVGAPALKALERYLREGRCKLVTGARRGGPRLLEPDGTAACRLPTCNGALPATWLWPVRLGDVAAHVAAFLRDPPARGRGRSCASSRSFSDTRRCAPRRCTRTSRRHICARPIAERIRGRRVRWL